MFILCTAIHKLRFYIPLGPGTVVPRDYGQPLYVKLNVILWLRAGRPLYFSNNGVVLATL